MSVPLAYRRMGREILVFIACFLFCRFVIARLGRHLS